MGENRKNKIVNVAYIAGEIGANLAGLWFPGIPIVAAVISGVKEWVDQKHLNDRLNYIEKSISEKEKKYTTTRPIRLPHLLVPEFQILISRTIIRSSGILSF